MIKEIIETLVQGHHLNLEESKQIINMIMEGELTQAQIGSILTALRMKGETATEIAGAALAMREKAVKINVQGDLIDTCGTGGDKRSTFNISTIAALVVAGCGVKVAKHGNKSVSSKCGSADLLESLGVNINVEVEVVEECINKIGFGFLYAPLFHKAMLHVVGPRKELGIRTIFNILGPLTNPAGAKYHILGTYEPNLTETIALALKNLNSKRAFVVHGEDGLDEITLTARTKISELAEEEVKTYYVSPENYGFKRCQLSDLRGGTIEDNANIALNILHDKDDPLKNIVFLNCAFALLCVNKVKTVEEGINLAREAIEKKKALEVLEKLKHFTQQREL
ncbi:anthranilate phosphoribosyltransferase [bacterium]|nr:anthranilate phosphoribosyltransferase [bacterium]MBU0899917.1 anthranilate phosphoribosyltransferase [bacterium]MBU1153109.1 anthranilate phosphoribosyltransferase [bacterium]MBU2600305.1 anthranilate phosphoribosyltransferase [bacterium]